MSSLEQKETTFKQQKCPRSVQAASDEGAALAKTDVRYWREAVFQPTYTRNGDRRKVDHYVVKLQFPGRRETIPLGTANREDAAQKAREIYLYLQSHGWEETLQKFKPKSARSAARATASVGEFYEQV